MDIGPIVVFAGSYFPAWIPSILLGIVVAAITYGLLLKVGLAQSIPLPGLFYTLLSGLAAMGLWAFLFSRTLA
ncbi:hypothetical protein THIOKS1640018 [Thiocapsa sp. KS1]|jgi:hypothetical protein|nr:YtcA family lipoprotein [Thiocapsa sp. KS1]CRI67523.1 hypothetical protein THIOKS1640018 [Thiocapsa sp. KS1]